MSRPRFRSQKASPQEMLAEGTEFLQFLERQDIATEDVTKQQLKSMYEVSYTMSKPLFHRRRGTPFSMVLRVLRNHNKVQIGRSGNVVIGTGEFLVARGTTAVDQHLGMRNLQFQLEAQGDADDGDTESALPDEPALREQKLLSWIKNHRDVLVMNKFKVEVNCEQDEQNGHINISLQKRAPFNTRLTIRNTSEYNNIQLLGCEMVWRKPQFVLTDDDHVASGLGEHLLGPGEEYGINLCVRPIRGYTRHFVPVIFHFYRRVDDRNFHIARFLSAGIDDELIQSLAPTRPYTPPPRVYRVERGTQMLDGVKPDPPQRDGLVMDPVGFYDIPSDLRWQLRGRGSDMLSGELSGDLTFAGYSDRFGKLLHTEEIQMEVDIQRYNMDNVPLMKDSNPRLLRLTVPGLAENRPSVLKGDHLFVQERFAGGQAWTTRYKGYVHHTELLEVKLGFNNQLLRNFITGMTVDVQFTFGRLPLRLQHRAVQQARAKALMQHVLFPKESSVGAFLPIRDPDTTVRHIVAGTSRPAPYLIFGPPGTGKTMTTVEAIKQVFTLDRGSVILACAPSNSAADLLAQRLIKQAEFKASLFRMNAVSRRWDFLPQDLKEANCCNYDSNREIYFPSKEEIIQRYRIVVTTLVTAGRLASANFPHGHFTHVFIDESGHAVEPEAVIPVAGLLSPESGGQLVLAGDPKQLGPVLRSPVAIKYGLAMSLLERLMTQCPLYQRGPDGQYDSRVLTKLVRNYRSHPAILKEPTACSTTENWSGRSAVTASSGDGVYADELVRESLCRWENLPKKNFPVIFHGVEGTDEREGNSPSFFNAREVATVLDYVHELLNSRGGMRVTQNNIGIISPYRRQVQKLQHALKLQNYSEIKVGSVEEFQGQERLVIIVSTVRSTRQEYLKMDKDYNLGFLNNPKRFNVAITRAKALLIVVGNPYTLSRDEYWGRFLEYCRKNGGYHPDSCEFQPRNDEVEDVLQRFAKVNLDGTSEPEIDEGSEFSQVQLQEDPEWRREN
ncbi:MOV10 [Branchiostoma lanceolatum]|uniref:RNA helicase n=1 Tax=Branchiostoma lanceolatum TaxID=7740 RepID=A0A8K0A1R0_BRALA|nr:MOV10 [Branchiostoma lanceolatum]